MEAKPVCRMNDDSREEEKQKLVAAFCVYVRSVVNWIHSSIGIGGGKDGGSDARHHSWGLCIWMSLFVFNMRGISVCYDDHVRKRFNESASEVMLSVMRGCEQ